MNCKPGDLAIVVSSLARENIGRIVEVVRFIFPNEIFSNGRKLISEGGGWLVRSDRPLVVTINGRPIGRACTRVFRDDCLRPISGVPVNDEVTDDVKEPA